MRKLTSREVKKHPRTGQMGIMKPGSRYKVQILTMLHHKLWHPGWVYPCLFFFFFWTELGLVHASVTLVPGPGHTVWSLCTRALPQSSQQGTQPWALSRPHQTKVKKQSFNSPGMYSALTACWYITLKAMVTWVQVTLGILQITELPV